VLTFPALNGHFHASRVTFQRANGAIAPELDSPEMGPDIEALLRTSLATYIREHQH
jgi:hypothetical protein